jgi:hypothetical protein
MTLLGELEAFYLEHRPCGELESDVADTEPFWVVMECTCGAVLARRVVPVVDPLSS